jgi:multisubunit Na+/H+ antiporter MnhG subunit
MAHVEVIAAFTAFAGLVVVWLVAPVSTHAVQSAAEPAAALQQIAA